ncbi:MAG: biotin/lipoyl-binding protein, partial [Acidobacteriota bacterium]
MPTLLFIFVILSQTGCDKSHLPFTDQEKLVFSGTIEQQEVRVGSKSGGRIREVLVGEGDLVEAGQTLVRFETAELEALLAQAEARVEQQTVRLERLERGARVEEKSQARAN